jgi:hypothetical protein
MQSMDALKKRLWVRHQNPEKSAAMSLTRPFVRRISDMSTDLINLATAHPGMRIDRNHNGSPDRSPPFALERAGSFTAGFGAIPQRSVRVDAVVWIASCLLTILGLAKAATSEQPVLWVALWPAPVVLASTVFTFLRQGFHFQDGLLVLGRRSE